MFDYFTNHDVDWDALRKAPDSDAKAEIKAASLDIESQWWQDVLDKADDWVLVQSCAAVEASYRTWVNDHAVGRTTKKSTRALGHYFRKMFERGGLPDWPKVTKTGPTDAPEG
jgi:hypothetical protein